MGKELVLRTMRHEQLDQVPWVPFAGVHAGKLKGYTAEEVLTDEDKLVESLLEVKRVYAPDGMPVMFDLQVEAEILGCELKWAQDNPPSVMTHPLEDTDEMPCACKMPTEESGRLPMILSAMRRVKKEVGDDTALYGLICGPFTLASHLRGTDIFLNMIEEPEYVEALMDYCAQVAIKVADMYIDAGMDIIAVVDPLVSQVSSDMVEEVLMKGFKAVFDHVRSRGVLSCFFVCGNATQQIEAMCKMGPDGISIDENVNIVDAKKVTDQYNICIGGNIPLTTTMLHGTQEDNMIAVLNILDSVDHHNLVVSPGCDMPHATPAENTVACATAVHSPDTARQMIANYQAPVDEDLDVEIPDYANLDKVLIELFLLDPEQCAACTYMQNSVLDAYDEIKDIAEYRIYKYFIKEDIARTKKMGIKNLPTMVINGEQKWISIIPNKAQLLKDVNEAYESLKK